MTNEEERDPQDLTPMTFEQEETADFRRDFLRNAIRLGLIFGLLICGVYFAFWWSGSAIRFGAARAGNRAIPTWKVWGTVRDAVTHSPIPWARIEDDPEGQAPYYQTDADQNGNFELLTLAEPHRLRISAAGYRTATERVGRQWFLWLPDGKEQHDIKLLPQ